MRLLIGTVIDLEDEFGNIHSITVSKNQLLYTLMDFIKDWKIIIDEKILIK